VLKPYLLSGGFTKRVLTSKKTKGRNKRAAEIIDVLLSGPRRFDSEAVKRAKDETAKANQNKHAHFNQFHDADVQEIKSLYKKIGKEIEKLATGDTQVIMEDRQTEDCLHDHIGELLNAIGVSVVDSDSLLRCDLIKMRLLMWCLCSRYTPHVEWPDVETELEMIDSKSGLIELAAAPGQFLSAVAEKAKVAAAAASTADGEEILSELASVQKELRALTQRTWNESGKRLGMHNGANKASKALSKAGKRLGLERGAGGKNDGDEKDGPSRLSQALVIPENASAQELKITRMSPSESRGWMPDSRRLPPLCQDAKQKQKEGGKQKEEGTESKCEDITNTEPFGI
jgi:hypothetical protein